MIGMDGRRPISEEENIRLFSLFKPIMIDQIEFEKTYSFEECAAYGEWSTRLELPANEGGAEARALYHQ